MKRYLIVILVAIILLARLKHLERREIIRVIIEEQTHEEGAGS